MMAISEIKDENEKRGYPLDKYDNWTFGEFGDFVQVDEGDSSIIVEETNRGDYRWTFVGDCDEAGNGNERYIKTLSSRDMPQDIDSFMNMVDNEFWKNRGW